MTKGWCSVLEVGDDDDVSALCSLALETIGSEMAPRATINGAPW